MGVTLVHRGEGAFAHGNLTVLDFYQGVDVVVREFVNGLFLPGHGEIAVHTGEEVVRRYPFDGVLVGLVGGTLYHGSANLEPYAAVAREIVLVGRFGNQAEAIAAVGAFQVGGALRKGVVDGSLLEQVILHDGITCVASFRGAHDIAFDEGVFRQGVSAHGSDGAELLEGECGAQLVVGTGLDDRKDAFLRFPPTVFIAEGNEGTARVIAVCIVLRGKGERVVGELAVLYPAVAAGITDFHPDIFQGYVDVRGYAVGFPVAVENHHGAGRYIEQFLDGTALED